METDQDHDSQKPEPQYWTDHVIDVIAWPFEKWPVLGEAALAGFAVWLTSKAHKY